MTPPKIDQILSLLEPGEIREALWLIDVFERWHVRPDEADKWRRRILAQQRFLKLDLPSHPSN